MSKGNYTIFSKGDRVIWNTESAPGVGLYKGRSEGTVIDANWGGSNHHLLVDFDCPPAGANQYFGDGTRAIYSAPVDAFIPIGQLSSLESEVREYVRRELA